MLTSVKRDNHTTLKTTIKPFPPWGERQGCWGVNLLRMLFPSLSPDWCRQGLSSVQTQQGQRETGGLGMLSPPEHHASP